MYVKGFPYFSKIVASIQFLKKFHLRSDTFKLGVQSKTFMRVAPTLEQNTITIS